MRTSENICANLGANDIINAISFEFLIFKMDNKMLSNWYYVVYFRAVRKNYILPGSWIQNIENHAEKFLNYGMNTTQSFLCFYTSNPQAFEENKCPKSDWPVNFSLKNRDSLQSDGCFIGKLLKCSGDHTQYHISRMSSGFA